MKIKLNLYIFLFLVLFLITNQIEIYSLVMIFALVHEVAHLICGVILGYEPDVFRIMPLGFSIEFKPKIEDYNKKILKSNIIALNKIIIALAGPFINILIVVIGLIFNMNTNIIYSNLLLFIFNLIPIYPLDGGRILKNIFKILFGNRRANEYINIITNFIFIILTMIFSVLIYTHKNIAILAIILVLWLLVIKENRKYFTYKRIYKIIDKTSN